MRVSLALQTAVKGSIPPFAQLIKKPYARRHLMNYEVGLQLAKSLATPNPNSNLVIVDAFPGAGVFSAALAEVFQPANHVLLEPFPYYHKFLAHVEEYNHEGKCQVSQKDPFRWATFDYIQKEGLVEFHKVPFSEPNNTLMYVANLTMAQGEQLCTQYLNCIQNRSWLARYGRVPMVFWVNESTAAKVLAQPSSPFRSRLSVQAEACAEISLIGGYHSDPLDSSMELPSAYLDNIEFLGKGGGKFRPVLIQLIPRADPIPNIDEFEYVTKMLFVTKKVPVKESLDLLGPGGKDDLLPLLDPQIAEKTPLELTVAEFHVITQVFADWPFRPTVLHTFFADEMYSS